MGASVEGARSSVGPCGKRPSAIAKSGALHQALLRARRIRRDSAKDFFSARSRLVDLTGQLRWGMFNRAGVVLAQPTPLNHKTLSEPRIVAKNEDRKIWEGARQGKIPHPSRRFAKGGEGILTRRRPPGELPVGPVLAAPWQEPTPLSL